MTRTRSLTAAIVALGLLAGFVAGVLPHDHHAPGQTRASAGTAQEPPLSPVIPAVDLSGVRMEPFHGYQLPVSDHDGPLDTSGDLASGYADTPLGALMAMINIGARTAWQFGPQVFQPTIQNQVTGQYTSQMLSGDQDTYSSDAPHIPDITVYAHIAAFQWEGYTPTDATADIVTAASSSDGATISAATQIQAQWINDDWRLIAPPGGDWANTATQISSLNGYTAFPGQGG